MRPTYQFSLFGAVAGSGRLLDPAVLKQYLDEHRSTPIPQEAERLKSLASWLTVVRTAKVSEASLEQRFIQSIMVEVLGYTVFPVDEGAASLFTKPPKIATGIKRTPDAMLGHFSTEKEYSFIAALELKSPGAEFDLPQAGTQTDGQSSETPVEQAFYYGRRILGVRWVLVSDMTKIRLYSVESQFEHEEFDLSKCIATDGRPTGEFRRLYFLLHYDHLVHGNGQASVATLHEKTSHRQLAIRDAFYAVYYDIRSCLHGAVREAARAKGMAPTSTELLQATQRLLDRLLFIYYCEDHPQHLLPARLVEEVTTNARRLPGPRQSKVYDHLKALFREVDAGSSPGSAIKIAAYNGELFKDHPIIDHIDLPDGLHDRPFHARDESGKPRPIQGVWGLHAFDFWSELNEHLLGHIFEESLSDTRTFGLSTEAEDQRRHEQRKRHGVFYTSALLSDFLCNSALQALLTEAAPIDASSEDTLAASLRARLALILSLRVLDPACGSGAFLVSAYREVIEEYWRVRAMLAPRERSGTPSLFDTLDAQNQAAVLRTSLFGADVLPQAVEIAKLALWLRSARKDEPVADLGGNIIVGDSLDVERFFARLQTPPGSFDLVVGNPPWGAELDAPARERAIAALGLTDADWDTWELFLMLALRALRVGGRLAFVLPDSLFYPEKHRIRRVLLEQAMPEKVHNLGPDWFGKSVRMGTVLLQARRGPVQPDADMLCVLLHGKLREDAISGRVPLTQVEAQRGRLVPIARTLASPERSIEVFRSKRDDKILRLMAMNGVNLAELCERARGEEMNKAGLAWECPSCLRPTVPGKKAKGGGYRAKRCPSCGLEITTANARELSVVQSVAGADPTEWEPFIDGDDITRRYACVAPSKWINVKLSDWDYKPRALYRPPKLLLRQAGVGLLATLDMTDARCPQSVYVYRLTSAAEAAGYTHEFILGALLSRSMAYVVFKRFAEVDPAKAHAKLTHERLAELPIPRVQGEDAGALGLVARVTANVRVLLAGKARLGGGEDLAIEQAIRTLWGLSPEYGEHINREIRMLPEGQAVRDLFPTPRGAPGSTAD